MQVQVQANSRHQNWVAVAVVARVRSLLMPECVHNALLLCRQPSDLGAKATMLLAETREKIVHHLLADLLQRWSVSVADQ